MGGDIKADRIFGAEQVIISAGEIEKEFAGVFKAASMMKSLKS